VHVEIHVHEVARLKALPQAGLAVRVVAARRDPLVQLLEVVGHARPVELVARLRDGTPVARYERGVAQEPLDLGTERQRVARLEAMAAGR